MFFPFRKARDVYESPWMTYFMELFYGHNIRISWRLLYCTICVKTWNATSRNSPTLPLSPAMPQKLDKRSDHGAIRYA